MGLQAPWVNDLSEGLTASDIKATGTRRSAVFIARRVRSALKAEPPSWMVGKRRC